MPQKLNDPEKKLELRLKKSDVKTMVTQYREIKGEKKLKFAHFNLQEIFDLLVDNKILDRQKLSQATIGEAKNYGLKLYLGHHRDDRYCPGKPSYKGHNTIVACNTKLNSGRFVDMLDDDKKDENNSIIISGYDRKIDDGDGLDMAQICPPECPGDDSTVTDIAND